MVSQLPPTEWPGSWSEASCNSSVTAASFKEAVVFRMFEDCSCWLGGERQETRGRHFSPVSRDSRGLQSSTPSFSFLILFLPLTDIVCPSVPSPGKRRTCSWEQCAGEAGKVWEPTVMPGEAEELVLGGHGCAAGERKTFAKAERGTRQSEKQAPQKGGNQDPCISLSALTLQQDWRAEI